MVRLLVADPDPDTADAVRRFAADGDHRVDATDGADVVLERLGQGTVDILVADHQLPGLPGVELARRAAAGDGVCQVVLVDSFGSVADAVAAIRAGAVDFVCKPFTDEQLRVALRRAIEHGRLLRENRDLRRALDDRARLDGVISNDERMQRVLKTIVSVAPTRTTVLLTGESGTGKTLLARALHRASDRAEHPFVEVNCGALPENLLESELFGHVRGAFTGAIKDRPGKFEAASGGTLFLDEIGTASPSLQVRLLRVLQDRVLERVGDGRSIPVDVRLVLATNLDLASEVRAGRFREDLYYRIHVVVLEMPPLRARRDDIPLLADHFLGRIAADVGKPLRGFAPAAMERLVAASWPGNVRQLCNVVERAVVLAGGPEIAAGDLPHDLEGPGLSPTGDRGVIGGPVSLLGPEAHLRPLRDALEEPERELIRRALEHFGGNRQRTARSLGINRSTLFTKMRRLGLT